MSEPVDPDKDGPGTGDDLSVPGSSSRSVTPTSGHGFLDQVARWGPDDQPYAVNAMPPSSTAAWGSGSSSATRSAGASVNTQMILGKKGSFSPPPTRPPPGPPPSGPPPLPPAPVTPTSSSHPYTPASSHPFANPSPNRNSPISKRTVSTPTTSTATPPTNPQSQARSQAQHTNAYASPSYTSPSPAARAASLSSPHASRSGSHPGISHVSASPSSSASPYLPSMASTLSPALPPPTSALPELPSSVMGHRRTVSVSSRTSKTSKRVSHSPPRVSPRNSSLLGSQQREQQTASASASASAASSSSSHAAHPLASSSAIHVQSQVRDPSSSTKPPRTPSRHLLQTALDLAQRAVEMDKRNDVTGALAAYREAVSRLKSVMARVGVEPTENGRPRKSTGRAEEEGRTLRGIHDAYEARIVLLSSFEEAEHADDDEPEVQEQRKSAHLSESAARRAEQRASASHSTATLVPAQHGTGQGQARSSGEATPPPSFDDTGTGIGNFMMTTQGDIVALPLDPVGTSSSAHGSPEDTTFTSTFSSRPLSTRTSSLHSSERGTQMHPLPLHEDVDAQQVHQGHTATGSPIQPPPRRTSMIAQQYAQHGPSTLGSPASARYSDSSHASQTPTESSGRRRGARAPRTSVGIESELNITEEEPDDGMEVLARTPHTDQLQQHPLIAAQLSPRRESMPGGMGVDARDRPLPPLPNSAPVVDQGGRVVSGSHTRQVSGSSSSGRPPSGTFLVNPNVHQAMLTQRRTSRGVDGVPLGPAVAAAHATSSGSHIDGLPGPSQSQPFPYTQHPSPGPSDAGSGVHTPRSRTRSQPGSVSGRMSMDEVPPLPHTVRHRTSFTSSLTGRVSSQSSQGHGNGLRINTDRSSSLVPPLPTSSRSSMRSHTPFAHSPSGTLISPIPEPQPSETVHRSFHLLRLICKSMDPMSTGAYLTSSIHVSPAVWQPSAWSKANGKLVNPPRIIAQDVKFRVLETMCFHLDLINKNTRDLIDGDRSFAHGRRISGSLEEVERTRREAEVLGKELAKSLSALDEDMTVGYKSLIKAGVPVGSWKEKGGGKKAGNSMSWSSKLKDKMTNGKTLESPDRYVDLLSHFSFLSQVLNEHLLNFTGLCTSHYAVMPEIQYRQVESRISSAANFFSAALVPFILDDVMQFVSRYIKGGAKYLEE